MTNPPKHPERLPAPYGYSVYLAIDPARTQTWPEGVKVNGVIAPRLRADGNPQTRNAR